MSYALQEVKRSALVYIGHGLWRRRTSPGMRLIAACYFALMRKSSRWWFQMASLVAVVGVLLVVTQTFVCAYINNQYLKQNGQQRLVVLEEALRKVDDGQTLKLALAQKALLEHIRIAKQDDTRYPLISRFGVDTSKTQVCPFSRELIISIEEGFIIPTAMQLEETLNGFYQNWPQNDKQTRDFLYPLYRQSFENYSALKNKPSDIDLERLATFWYQSLNKNDASQGTISIQDLKGLLSFYFRLKSTSVQLNTELATLVEKQLDAARG